MSASLVNVHPVTASSPLLEASPGLMIWTVVIFLISSKQMLLLPMVGVGIAWASVLTMPYAILAGALPANRMGYYMGLFNFFVVIPQIIAGVVLGAILKYFFDNQSVKVLMLGGACMILAGLLTLLVKDEAVEVASGMDKTAANAAPV